MRGCFGAAKRSCVRRCVCGPKYGCVWAPKRGRDAARRRLGFPTPRCVRERQIGEGLLAIRDASVREASTKLSSGDPIPSGRVGQPTRSEVEPHRYRGGSIRVNLGG